MSKTADRADNWIAFIQGWQDKGCCISEEEAKVKDILIDLLEENNKLRGHIIKCLNNNAHLADGDNCTLHELKKAVPEWEA
jgi:hypothetical protein